MRIYLPYAKRTRNTKRYAQPLLYFYNTDTQADKNQERIVNSNGIPVLVNLLQTVKGHEIIIGNTLDCIYSMTEDNCMYYKSKAIVFLLIQHQAAVIEIFLQHGLLHLLTPHFFQMLAGNLATNPGKSFGGWKFQKTK